MLNKKKKIFCHYNEAEEEEEKDDVSSDEDFSICLRLMGSVGSEGLVFSLSSFFIHTKSKHIWNLYLRSGHAVLLSLSIILLSFFFLTSLFISMSALNAIALKVQNSVN